MGVVSRSEFMHHELLLALLSPEPEVMDGAVYMRVSESKMHIKSPRFPLS